VADNETPFKLPFLKKEQLTKDTYTFYFKRTGEERDFIPGQYYEIKLDIPNADERGDSRVFTISSSPTDKEFITITTRIIQSSFKLRLNKLQPEEIVQFNGPWDDLNFDENDNSPHVFLAGGIGVTPYHSIVKYAEDKNINTSMTLLVSWKNYDEMVFDDFFRAANDKLSNFSYVPTLTEENEMSADVWDGERGRINEEMIRKYVHDIPNSKYFFAGPPAMVKALKETVQGMGVPNEKIIAEEFEGY
jgi:ferredoxin-NADP reductase